jgi:PAS domain S-box-containing protein
MSVAHPQSVASFAQGEMADLIRNFPWEIHPLGNAAEWHPVFHSTLSLVLESRFPMFLYWGKDNFCFYNDAFRLTMGSDKHPHALGKPAPEVWPEVWPGIKAVIDQINEIGTPVYAEDSQTWILRNGKLDETFWTFSYSPVRDLNGAILGVLSVCMETTEKVNATQALQKSEESLRHLMEQAPVGILVVKGEEMIMDFANDLYLSIVDRDKSWIGKPIWDCLPEVREQGYDQTMRDVFRTGKPFRSAEQKIDIRKKGELVTGYFTFSYDPLRDENGTINSVMVLVTDVTEQIFERQKVEYAEERMRQAIDASQLGTFDYNLLTNEIVTSERFNQIWGYIYSADHNSLVDAIHPDDLIIRERAHRRAYSTGHLNYEARVIWKNKMVRWVRVDGKVFYDKERTPIRMIGSVLDITEATELRERLTRTADSLQLALKAGRLGSYEYDINTGRIDCTEQCKLNFGLLRDDALNFERLLTIIIPEDRKGMMQAVENSIRFNIPYDTEYRIGLSDGSIRWIHASGLPVYDKKGRPQQLIGVTSDVTVQKARLN